MPEKPEAEPIESHVDALIRDVAMPLISRAANEIGHPLSAKISVMKDGEVTLSRPAISSPGSEPQDGEIRIRFRRVSDEKRRLFFLEALFPEDRRAPAFTGFFCRGDVTESSGVLKAKYATWVVKREDPSWTAWL